MFKNLYPILLLVSSYIYSQNSQVFTDNFSGIESVQFNPATIVDTYYKVDIHLLGTATGIGNTYAVISPFDILQDVKLQFKDFKLLKFNSITSSSNSFAEASGVKNLKSYQRSIHPSSNSNFYGNGTLLGPSFLVSVNKYNAVGFTSAVRFNGFVKNFNTQLYDKLDNQSYLEDIDKLINNQLGVLTGNGAAFAWFEAGFTYATIPVHTANELLKVGVSLKFLRGIKSSTFSFNNFATTFVLDAETPENSNLNLDGSIKVTYSREGANYGQGLDIGFVFEKRTKTLPINKRDKLGNIYYSKSPYKYKLSGAITDIGFLLFNNVSEQTNPVHVNLTNSNFSFSEYLQINTTDTQKKTYFLPTTAHVSLDYNINNHWYINTNLDVFLLANTKNAMRTVSTISATPRFESNSISFFLPVSVNSYGIYNSGVGFRTGYFFAGSASVLSNLTSQSKEIDFFMGIKIPIYNKKVLSDYKESIRKYSLIKRKRATIYNNTMNQ